MNGVTMPMGMVNMVVGRPSDFKTNPPTLVGRASLLNGRLGSTPASDALLLCCRMLTRECVAFHFGVLAASQ